LNGLAPSFLRRVGEDQRVLKHSLVDLGVNLPTPPAF